MTSRLAAALLAITSLAVTGCGGDSGQASKPTLKTSSKLVDKTQTPYVNALELASDGSFLLTTNRGFWRIAKDGSKVTPVRGATVTAPSGKSPVGKFLELVDLGDGRFGGSGHPDDEEALPPFLGYMESRDEGRTWRVISRLGTADLHIIRRVGERIYAWDAVLGAVLISENGGRRFVERFTPQELILDLVIDPKDPDYLLISADSLIYKSENAGRSWRPAAQGERARMTWLPSGELLRATRDGTWSQSTDRGLSWKEVGELPGEPYKIRAVDPRTFHVALADGSIASSTDGGATWRMTFRAS